MDSCVGIMFVLAFMLACILFLFVFSGWVAGIAGIVVFGVFVIVCALIAGQSM